MLGVHPSMLPKYRGANPIARAILAGDSMTGVTIFRLNERMDAGEIALQQAAPIADDETTEQLSPRLAELGAQLLVDTVRRMEQGTVTWQAQDDAQATIAAKFAKEDGVVDWSAPAEQVDRLIRAVAGWPGATTTWRGQPLKICAARVAERESTDGAPGRLMSAAAEGLLVATGRGRVLVTEVQLAGSRRMAVGEFLRGRPLQPGEVFGSRSEPSSHA
jgi:methionyl-tRNA formyltransferase